MAWDSEGATLPSSDGGPHTTGASPGQWRGERTVQTRRLGEGCALGDSGMCCMILGGWMDGLDTRDVVVQVLGAGATEEN